MRTRTTLAAGLLIAAGLGLAACDPNSTTADPAPATTTPSVPSVAATTDAPDTATLTSQAGAPVPSLVGQGLQAAQDAAQADGFYNLTSHDSAGRGRMQILDRDWKVCSQTPKAGSVVATDTKVDLGAVKLTETCPATDQKPPAKAGATMPNFVGKSLNTAEEALPKDLSLTVADATSQGRMVVLASNWQVCTQKPAAGVVLDGQLVMFRVVKFGESCP
jgi:hypothetical protein